MSITLLPDGSALGFISYPLPKDHWLYAPREYEGDSLDPKELPEPILDRADHADAVTAAIRYAIRAATDCGRADDFDPDALVQNALYALCGPALPMVAASRLINGYAYLEPETVPPVMYHTYFFPRVDVGDAGSAVWCDEVIDRWRLKAGLVHRTLEAAQDHARALIAAGGGEA